MSQFFTSGGQSIGVSASASVIPMNIQYWFPLGLTKIRLMNQGKLEVVKHEVARVNMDILGISALKWTGMGESNSDDHYIYYCGQESLWRNGVALIVNKRVWNAVLVCNLKNDNMISVSFQGKPFNITLIQVYAPTTNAKEAKSWMVLWWPTRPSITNTQKRCPFRHRGLKCKSKKSRDTWSNRQIWLGGQNEAGQKLIDFCQENALVIANTLFQQHKRWLYTWTSPDGQYQNQIDYFFFATKDGEALYS